MLRARTESSAAAGLPHVVVVGGGFTGAALVVHLLRQPARTAPRVTLLEQAPRVGRGVAYGTDAAEHLLNVPAARMSLLPEDPDHFLRWAAARRPAVGPYSFLPRALYGQYVADTLRRTAEPAQRAGSYQQIHAQAQDVLELEGRRGFVVQLAETAPIAADVVVLANGHGSPSVLLPDDPFLAVDPRFCADPWAPGALQDVMPEESVALVGTGLTMVDVVLQLRAQGHRGALLAFSRHGLLPRAHTTAPAPAWRLAFEPAARDSLAAWVSALRAEVRRAAAAGAPWQSVLDALRPRTAELWQRLDARRRRQFLEHLRPFWEAHRHRMAPEATARVQALCASGALAVCAARLLRVQRDGLALALQLLPRGQRQPRLHTASRLVNCTGPDFNLQRAGDPLVRRMLQRGLLAQDPLQLGLQTAGCGNAVRADGRVHASLYVLGPARRPLLWETTAVPEIAAQARAFAESLAGAAAQAG
jgi:uncharacterized NAD(P)/FAD-binding protein YdhS